MGLTITATVILVLVVVVLLLAVLAAWTNTTRARSAKLQSRFGPEYERTLEAAGSRKEAEQELAARQRRVEEFNLRPLSAPERQQFADRWRDAQAQFVDQPEQAIGQADRLVNEVMQARGYPVADFDRRAADLSVDHAAVIANYRAARELMHKQEQRLASTEDLRQAMVHYRALFDDLLAAPAEQAQQKETVA
jgi:hypothetical protein